MKIKKKKTKQKWTIETIIEIEKSDVRYQHESCMSNESEQNRLN